MTLLQNDNSRHTTRQQNRWITQSVGGTVAADNY